MTPQKGHFQRVLGYPCTCPVNPLLYRTVLEQQRPGAADRARAARPLWMASAGRAIDDAEGGVDAVERGELCDELLQNCSPPRHSCRAVRVPGGRGRRCDQSGHGGPG